MYSKFLITSKGVPSGINMALYFGEKIMVESAINEQLKLSNLYYNFFSSYCKIMKTMTRRSNTIELLVFLVVN